MSRSTSSRVSEKRRASSFARSRRSPISRCRRSDSESTTSSEAARSSGSSMMSSASAWTWPWIAVSGVRSSCETRIRKFRSSSSASLSLRAISWKRAASMPSSSRPWVRSSMSYMPEAMRSDASDSSLTGRVMRRPRNSAATSANSSARTKDGGEPLGLGERRDLEGARLARQHDRADGDAANGRDLAVREAERRRRRRRSACRRCGARWTAARASSARSSFGQSMTSAYAAGSGVDPHREVVRARSGTSRSTACTAASPTARRSRGRSWPTAGPGRSSRGSPPR